MPLPSPPQQTGDVERDVQALYYYLWDVVGAFANAAGAAIDPSMGEGGADALTVTEVPTGIGYVGTSATAADGTFFGAIEASYTLPDRAVGVLIKLRQQGQTVFQTHTSVTSPERIINLGVGAIYQIQMAGYSANGLIGPYSTLTDVTIPITGMLVRPSNDAEFLVGLLDPTLTKERLVTDTATAAWDLTIPGIAKVNVPDSAITNAKLATVPGLTLKGNDAAVALAPQDLTVAEVLAMLGTGASNVTLTGVRKTSDQVLGALGNVTSMAFNVIAGKYYNIRFAVIAHSDAALTDVNFAVTYPGSTVVGIRGVPTGLI